MPWAENEAPYTMGDALSFVSIMLNRVLGANVDFCPPTWKADGNGPNLELHGGKPYDYISSIIVLRF